MKPVNEIVPKGTPPCNAPPDMECRVVMKSFRESSAKEFEVFFDMCDGEKCEPAIKFRTIKEIRKVMKPVNEIVPKRTETCDAPPNMECRSVMKLLTETIPVTFSVPYMKCKNRDLRDFCERVFKTWTIEEKKSVMKATSEIVAKGTPPCDAPLDMECRIVMKPFTETVPVNVT